MITQRYHVETRFEGATAPHQASHSSLSVASSPKTSSAAAGFAKASFGGFSASAMLPALEDDAELQKDPVTPPAPGSALADAAAFLIIRTATRSSSVSARARTFKR